MLKVNDLKEAFRGLCGNAKLKSIIDYTKEDMIIVYESHNAIPGMMFRVNKKTGKTTEFCPAEDLIGFAKAATKRTILF